MSYFQNYSLSVNSSYVMLSKSKPSSTTYYTHTQTHTHRASLMTLFIKTSCTPTPNIQFCRSFYQDVSQKTSTQYIQKLKYCSSPNLNLSSRIPSRYTLSQFMQSPKLKSNSSYYTIYHSHNPTVTKSHEFYLLNICTINLILCISTDATFVQDLILSPQVLQKLLTSLSSSCLIFPLFLLKSIQYQNSLKQKPYHNFLIKIHKLYYIKEKKKLQNPQNGMRYQRIYLCSLIFYYLP